MRVNTRLLHGVESETRKLFVFYTISICCHLIFFTVLTVLPGIKPPRKFFPSVIDVRLVALPSPTIEPSPDRPSIGTPEKPAPAEVVPKKTVRDKTPRSDAVPVTPKKYKKKISLKKRTFKSSKVLEHAISKIEEKVESSRADPVVKAIDRLKQEIEETAEIKSDTHRSTALGETGDGKQRDLELMDIYQAEIHYHIKRNWVFNEQLAGGRTDLFALVVIEIKADGHIADIWFDERSGNRYFDDQTYKAVKKSDPLPSLPEGYSRSSYTIGLHFTPLGPEK